MDGLSIVQQAAVRTVLHLRDLGALGGNDALYDHLIGQAEVDEETADELRQRGVTRLRVGVEAEMMSNYGLIAQSVLIRVSKQVMLMSVSLV